MKKFFRICWMAVGLTLATSSGARAVGPVAAADTVPGRGESYARALALVERARASLGGVEALRRSGGILVEGVGTYDLGVRLQGTRPWAEEPVELRERLAVDVSGGRVAYETDGRVNPDAREWMRYVHDADGQLILDLLNRRAYRDVGAEAAARGARYAMAVPHVLVAAALDRRGTLVHGGGSANGESVAFTLPGGETVLVELEPERGLPVAVEYVLDLPLEGDAVVRWSWGPYREVAGLGPYPTGHVVELNGRPLRRVRYTRVEAGAEGSGLFERPEDIEVPPPPSAPAAGSAATGEASPARAARPPVQVRELAPGVWLAPNVRPGFHHLVVEFPGFTLVTDAPAGWHELQQLPAADFVAGATSSSTGERLLEAARAAAPGKPVRYVALSHHHSDHAGGVRPFIAAGATVLGTAPTLRVVERAAAAPFTLAPDELAGRPIEPRLEEVRGERVIREGDMEVRLLDVGPNPHAAGMLAVWVPSARILWVADLFDPRPADSFPPVERVPVMRWFVDWLDRSGLEPERIYAAHGQALVTEENLAAIRAMR